MDYYSTILQRTSCRNYENRHIPEDLQLKLRQVIASSPSSGGFQNYSVIHITSEETKKKISKLCRRQGFIASAPSLYVFCLDLHRERRIAESYSIPPCMNFDHINLMMLTIDAAIAAQNLCTAAELEGLGSCYIGNILNNIKEISDILCLPEQTMPVIMVTLGYPASHKAPTDKYGAEILVHEESYQELPLEILQAAWKEKYSAWTMKPNNRLLSRIRQVSAAAFGEEYADKGIAYIIENNLVDPYSFWNAFYYSNTEDIDSIDVFIEYLKNQKLL